MNIVIVDDKADERYLLRFLLESQGYSVVEFEDGKQALQFAHSNPPDMIISDILMPIMDGYALLYAVRKDEILARTPFVIYTAVYTEAADQELAYKLGANRFVARSTDPDDFAKEIEIVFQEQASGTSHSLTQPLISELDYYSRYSERLVVKLEEKLGQMKQTNRLLRDRSEELRRKSEENSQLLAQAQTALELRDHFLSVAAHELRTPLTTLKGWLQLSQRGLHKADYDLTKERDSMEKALMQTRRMERLISDMTDAVDATEGHLRVDLQLCNLVDIVRGLFADEYFWSAAHQIVFDLPGKAVYKVRVDEVKLRRALLNLIDNAIKFSPEGGEVRVRLNQFDDEPIVSISISDQGPGIPVQEREQIFQPYYQGDTDHRSRRYGGLGLGLFVSKKIIEAHNGELKLSESSSDPQGTTLIVHLPLVI